VPFFQDYTAGELAMRAMGVSQIRMMLSAVITNNILTSFFTLFNLACCFITMSNWPGCQPL
jgi:ATP-binding cassette subfamily C protein